LLSGDIPSPIDRLERLASPEPSSGHPVCYRRIAVRREPPYSARQAIGGKIMKQAVTLRIDPDLLAAARQCASSENRTLTNFVETVLKQHIVEVSRSPKKFPVSQLRKPTSPVSPADFNRRGTHDE
jgi:hypothetical protein